MINNRRTVFGSQRANAALGPVSRNPSQLRRDQQHHVDHGHPPPPYGSPESLPSTASPPTPPPADQELGQLPNGASKLDQEFSNSDPYSQFNVQVKEECVRRADLAKPRYSRRLERRIRQEVKAAWIEQGIWDDDWDDEPGHSWRHERPLVDSPESASDPEPGSPEHYIIFGLPKPPKVKKAQRKKTEEEKREAAERHALRRTAMLQAREQTRPLSQFLYQVEQEKKRLLREHEAQVKAAAAAGPSSEAVPTTAATAVALPQEHTLPPNVLPNINSVAYEHVKATWVQRRIWRASWGVLPGLSWQHELEAVGVTDGGSPPRPKSSSASVVPRESMRRRSLLRRWFRSSGGSGGVSGPEQAGKEEAKGMDVDEKDGHGGVDESDALPRGLQWQSEPENKEPESEDNDGEDSSNSGHDDDNHSDHSDHSADEAEQPPARRRGRPPKAGRVTQAATKQQRAESAPATRTLRSTRSVRNLASAASKPTAESAAPTPNQPRRRSSRLMAAQAKAEAAKEKREQAAAAAAAAETVAAAAKTTMGSRRGRRPRPEAVATVGSKPRGVTKKTGKTKSTRKSTRAGGSGSRKTKASS